MRVVIAEDEALLREGLVLLLESTGTEVVGVISDAPSLVPMVSSRAPDLVISDIRMPPGDTDDGLRAALEVRRTHPEIAIMILSQYVHRQYALELLGDNPAGVGYLLKQRVANADAFCRDVRRVVRRETVLDTQVGARCGHELGVTTAVWTNSHRVRPRSPAWWQKGEAMPRSLAAW